MLISSFKVLSWLWENRQNNQQTNTSCILQCGDPFSISDSTDEITLKKWKNIQEQSEKWTGLDTFESVFTIVDWKLGPTGLFMHNSCYIKLCSPRNLAQSQKRKEKQSQNVASEDESSFNSGTTITDESFSFPAPKRTCSTSIVHGKTKCIWYFNGPDRRRSNPKSFIFQTSYHFIKRW